MQSTRTTVTSVKAAKFEFYERLIPEKDKLTMKLDCGDDCELHLHEIAHIMKEWELVAPRLKLTPTDINDIKEVYERKPELQRVTCLQKWKSKLGIKATYGLLLDVCLSTENDECADKIVELLGGDPSAAAKGPTDEILDTAQPQTGYEATAGDQYPLESHSIVAVPGNIVTDDGNSIDSAIGGRWRLLSILRNHRRKFSGSDDSSENICMYMKKLWESLCNKLDVSPSPYPLNQDEIKTSVTIHWLISTIHAWKVLERIEFVVKFFETQSISTVSLENVSIYYNSSIAHQEIRYVKLLLTIQDAEKFDSVNSYFQKNFPDINAPVIEEEGKTALILAAECGHECVVYSLLQLRPQIDINYQTPSEQWSALFFAYKKGHFGVVKLLLEYAADSTLKDRNRKIASDMDPTKRGLKYYLKKVQQYAKKKLTISKWSHKLLTLSANGDYEGVKCYLQESQCSVDVEEHGWTALSVACSNNFVRIASLLLENRAKPNRVIGVDSSNFTPLMYISDMDHVEPLATALLQNGASLEIESKPSGWTPLILACHSGKKDLVQLYLDYGAEVDKIAKKGWTALMSAARFDRADIIRLLVAKGASMEARIKDSDSDSKIEGESALHIASYTGSASAVKVLVELGSDPNSLNEVGLSALQIAAQCNQLEVVETLCDSKKVDIDFHKEDFLPALLIAAKNGNDKILAKLLSCDAYVPDGILMIDIGLQYKNKKIVKEFDRYKKQQQQRKQEEDKHQSSAKCPRSIPACPVPETGGKSRIAALEKPGHPEFKDISFQEATPQAYSEKLKEMTDKHDRKWNHYVKSKDPHFVSEDTVGTDQCSMETGGDGHGSSIHNLQLLGTQPIPNETIMGLFQLVTNNRGEKYELIKDISGKWRRIGTHLGLTPNQLDGIRTDKDSEEHRFMAVMDDWRSNASRLPNGRTYPYSWIGLHTLLVDSNLNTYADKFIDFIVHSEHVY